LPKAAAEFFPLPEDDEPDECVGGEESALMLLLKIAAEDEAEARSIIAELICRGGDSRPQLPLTPASPSSCCK
jgi:hypothetical protein